MLPGWNPKAVLDVSTAEDGFVSIRNCNITPTVTTQEGIFAAGTAAGPNDIVDTIMTAGAAAAEAAAFMQFHDSRVTAITENKEASSIVGKA
jgi:heterodisulfide reductase subunit A-like polyferredoxin